MRKPITQASFHPSVREWSFDRFQSRYFGQFTDEEITRFATSLGLVSEPAAGVTPAPVNIEPNGSLKQTQELTKKLRERKKVPGTRVTPSDSGSMDNTVNLDDKTKTEGGE